MRAGDYPETSGMSRAVADRDSRRIRGMGDKGGVGRLEQDIRLASPMFPTPLVIQLAFGPLPAMVMGKSLSH